MQQLLFALVVTICPIHDGCADVIYDIFNSKSECEAIIYEKRIFNGGCYEVEAIIHQK